MLFSPGHLYGAPFVSQYLLYRFDDIDCSLLFCEEAGVVGTTEVNIEARTISRRAMVREPKVVYLHRSSSAKTSLLELSEIPALEITFAESPEKKRRIDGLTISLEPVQLPSSRGFLLLDKRAPSVAHEIEGTAYTVKTPDSLCHAPDFAKRTLNDAFYRCYRLSVVNEQNDRCYNFDSDQQWSLSAMGMVIDWKPVYEGILQRGNHLSATNP
jgi:hypothetical protein